MKISLGFCMAVLLSAWSVQAGFFDDFSGASLDPAWHLSFDGSVPDTGWVPTVSNSYLQLRDFNDQLGGDGQWANAYFKRAVDPAAEDFTLSMKFSWSDVSEPALQQLKLSLHTDLGTEVGSIWFYDLRASERPGYSISGGGSSMGIGHDGLASNSSGDLIAVLMRTDGVYTGSWNGYSDPGFLGTGNQEVTEVRLQVSHYYYNELGYFRPMDIDAVEFTTPIPEPSSMALIGIFGIGLYRVRRLKMS